MANLNLIEQALKEFNMTLPDFTRHIDFPKSTIQTWMNKDKIPRCGEIMLTALMENKQFKERDEAVKKVLSLYGLQPQ